MKSLPPFIFLALALVTVALALQLTGCDVHTDRQHALYAKTLSETRVLLVNLKAYKEKNGHLPASLSELASSEPVLARMNLAEYTYGSNGIPVADGSSWLVSTPDPKHDGRVIVGRFPIEVTNAIPAKITRPNAGGPRQSSIPTPLAARVGQFYRWAEEWVNWMKRIEREAITMEMNISRRNLFVLGGGAVTAALLARPDILHAGSDGFAVKAESQRGKVKIRDVQSASIADEYACNLIKITTDSGLYGIGEARCKIPVAKQVKAFNELVVGEDPLRVDYLKRKMMAAIKRPSLGDIGVVAGIETALWDLAGKMLNTPTYNVLGGSCRDKIKVYYDLAPADSPKTTEPAPWVECAQRAKKAGFGAMKVDIYRGGGDVPEWVRILQAIRADVGPDMLLGVEFHWRLNSEQTDRFIAMTEDLNLWFIEDPMPYENNLAHYQRVTAAGKIPIVALEQMLTLKSFHEMIEERMCTIIEPDAQYCGGLSELKRVADLGELYGMDTLCHNMCSPIGTYAQAHACATIHKFVAMESACADNVIQHEGSLYRDGYLVLNDKPGLGIELNEDYCRKQLSKGSTYFGT